MKNYKALMIERKQILNLIDWIADSLNKDQQPEGYEFMNYQTLDVTPDTFKDDPERLEAWTYMTNCNNSLFVNRRISDRKIYIEEGLHFEGTMFCKWRR